MRARTTVALLSVLALAGCGESSQAIKPPPGVDPDATEYTTQASVDSNMGPTQAVPMPPVGMHRPRGRKTLPSAGP